MRWKFLVTGVLCLVVCAVISALPTTHTTTSAIQGYVFNQNCQPVSGVYVKITDSWTGEIYGEGMSDASGYYYIPLKECSVGREVDISWKKGNCSRQEFGLLIPKENYISRTLYTYMTIETEEKSVTVFVYDYSSGQRVSNVTVSAEDARTLIWLAKAVTNEEGVAIVRLPANITVNIYANANNERNDILGGQELGVDTHANRIVTIYVEKVRR